MSTIVSDIFECVLKGFGIKAESSHRQTAGCIDIGGSFHGYQQCQLPALSSLLPLQQGITFGKDLMVTKALQRYV